VAHQIHLEQILYSAQLLLLAVGMVVVLALLLAREEVAVADMV
jgi:hypothetical protein